MAMCLKPADEVNKKYRTQVVYMFVPPISCVYTLVARKVVYMFVAPALPLAPAGGDSSVETEYKIPRKDL